MIDVDGKLDTQHDTVDVAGQLEMGGTVSFTLSPTSTVVPGDTFKLISAKGVAGPGVFKTVQTFGSDSLFVAIDYPTLSPGSGSAAADEFDVDGHVFRGDMNHMNGVTTDDIRYFVMALNDPEKYFHTMLPTGACICDFGQAAGDLGSPAGKGEDGKYVSDGQLTFDDINAFADLLGMSHAAFAAAMKSIPEPSSAFLAAAGVTILLGRHRRRGAARHLIDSDHVGQRHPTRSRS